MATLGNILARVGGIPMTPRIVEITLAVPSVGAPVVQQAKVALLPVSIPKQARSVQAAIQAIKSAQEANDGDALDLGREIQFRFLLESLRDPDDLRKSFCEIENIGKFRESLIPEQLSALAGEYDELIRSEYLEIVEYAQRIKEQAAADFPKGQDSR